MKLIHTSLTLKKALLIGLLCFGFSPLLAFANPFLSDRHIERGFTCAQCHLEPPPSQDVEMDQCFTCHIDYDKLAVLTEKTLPHNPHDSHLGEAQCSDCHKGHQTPVLYCNECHVYDMTVP